MDSLGGAVRKLSNKRSSISLWKKYYNVVSFNCETCAKVAKLARDFDIPKNDNDYNFEKDRKNNFRLFLSEYTRKHDTVSGNPN